MKNQIFLLVALIATVAFAAPQKSDKDAQIISQDSDTQPDGGYNYRFETDNGITGQETGTLKKAASADASDVIIANGQYSYTSPDGTVITVTYVADDVGGFQPQGDHLPTPPPIPPAIQKALDYIASLPPARTRK